MESDSEDEDFLASLRFKGEEDEEYDSSGDDLPLISLKEARQMDEIHAAISDNFQSESDTDSDGTEEFEFRWCLDDV